MTRSGPPDGEPAAAQSYPPGQYPAPQNPAPQYPASQYPTPHYPAAPGQTDGSLSSPREYGQPVAGSPTPTVALQAGPPDYPPPVAEVAAPQQQSAVRPNRRPTRIGAAWVALIVAAVVLIFLLIFIVQNSGPVQISYFGFAGTIPLGVAMLFAAVAGALTAGLLGTVRILQMRKKARQASAVR